VIFMMFSAVFIDQYHGLIEMHFSVFVLLAFLLFYRDWRPVCVAAAAIAVHHFVICNCKCAESRSTFFHPATDATWCGSTRPSSIFQAACLVYLGEIIPQGSRRIGH